MARAARDFIPVFIDTLNDLKTTRRFKERYGSYPVLRVHDGEGKDIAGRLDGNKVAGKLSVEQVLDHLEKGRKAFRGK